MKELETIRARFLVDDLDEEDRADNEALLKEWEEGLVHNEAYLEWQSNDITREISQKMKAEYKEFGLILSTNRTLTEEQRKAIWAKQDACMFILSLTDRDAKGAITQIKNEIKKAISAT